MIETSPDSARSDLSMKYLFTSKNLTHRQKLYRWVVIGCWVVMGYACVAVIVFNDDWGQWRFYGGFAAMGLPLLVLFFSLRFVWATLRWWLRDMLRAAKGPSRGKHAKEPAPGLALFSLAIVVGILAAVVYPSWQQRVALAQDWWQGPVRHDNVRCVVKGDLSSLSTLKSQSWKFAEFDLVGEDGYSQHFMLKFADLDRETDRIDSPFNTVADVCELPWTTMTVRVYPRTGIIDEASVSK